MGEFRKFLANSKKYIRKTAMVTPWVTQNLIW